MGYAVLSHFSPRAGSESTILLREDFSAAAGQGPAYPYAGIRVSFAPNPVVTGYRLDGQMPRIKRRVTATVVPKEEMDKVRFRIFQWPKGKARADLQTTPYEKDEEKGTWSFDVFGHGPIPGPTPAQKNNPYKPAVDTWIQATLEGSDPNNPTILGGAQVIVVIPKAIGLPHPQIGAGQSAVTAVNHGANAKTSPAWPHPLTKKYLLWTYWAHWLAIPVVDQFNNPTDSIYQGLDVEEPNGSKWVPINQKLNATGSYSDPVFVYQYKGNSPTPTEGNQAELDAWLQDPPAAFVIEQYDPQDLGVRVGGHVLGRMQMINNKPVYSPPNAIQGRQIIVPSVNHVEITWP